MKWLNCLLLLFSILFIPLFPQRVSADTAVNSVKDLYVVTGPDACSTSAYEYTYNLFRFSENQKTPSLKRIMQIRTFDQSATPLLWRKEGLFLLNTSPFDPTQSNAKLQLKKKTIPTLFILVNLRDPQRYGELNIKDPSYLPHLIARNQETPEITERREPFKTFSLETGTATNKRAKSIDWSADVLPGASSDSVDFMPYLYVKIAHDGNVYINLRSRGSHDNHKDLIATHLKINQANMVSISKHCDLQHAGININNSNDTTLWILAKAPLDDKLQYVLIINKKTSRQQLISIKSGMFCGVQAFGHWTVFQETAPDTSDSSGDPNGYFRFYNTRNKTSWRVFIDKNASLLYMDDHVSLFAIGSTIYQYAVLKNRLGKRTVLIKSPLLEHVVYAFPTPKKWSKSPKSSFFWDQPNYHGKLFFPNLVHVTVTHP